jgi:sulfur carrier protein
MRLYVNDEEVNLNKENGADTLLSVLNDLGIENQKGIAIAINNEVISRINWNAHKINENDKILIIKATQGG